MQGRKKAFTLLEVIIALSLFEFVMIGVIMAVNRAYAYVQSTKIQVMAVNLAREGIEQIYTIRDTNWRKHSAEKDKYWLLADPMTGNITAPLISSGVYVLHLNVTGNQQYPLLTAKTVSGTITDFYDHFDTYTGEKADWKMPFTGGFYSGNTLVTDFQDVMENDADFYRIVRVYGLYKKDVDEAITCTQVGHCADNNPKELRFCVKVWYFFTFRGSTELCGIMTNFRE